MTRTERRAAIYARISTDKQNPLSPADQVRKCREYALQHGITVLDDAVFVDEGLSGVGNDRPGLQELLRQARSRRFNVILFDDTSRFSRSMAGTLTMFEELRFIGVDPIFVSQDIDGREERTPMLLGIHGLMDNFYVRELAKKVHRGCESAVLRGRHVGGRCYGYRAVADGDSGSKRLEVDESQAPVVRQIFEMSANSKSLKRIARRLNEECAGGRANWAASGIRSMLRQEIYRGEVIWNRTKFEKVPGTNTRRPKPRDESEWVRRQRPDLAIVPVELWNRVRDRLNVVGRNSVEGRKRGLVPRAITSPYLFSGLLKCSECGGNLIVATGGGTHHHKKYACSNRFYRGTCKNRLYIRVDALETRLLGQLQSELLRPEVIEHILVEFGRQLRTALAGLSGNIADLRKQKERLESEIRRFVDAIARGGCTPDSLAREIAIREAEVKTITNRLLSTGENSIDSRLQEIRQFVTSGISDLRSLLGRDPVLAKAELHSHLSEIRMTPAEDGKGWHYIAEGAWNLLGSGPSAPAFSLAHSDGCGGLI